MFTSLLANIVNASNNTKCVTLSNQKWILMNIVKNVTTIHFRLDRCVGSCDNLNDFSNEICVPNKTEDLNLSMFNMITGMNELKTLTMQISCECKCKFYGRKCNSDQRWNKKKCRCECKKHHVCKKDYVWNPATWNCENGQYLASIMNDSAITCDEIIDAEAKLNDEETKTCSINFNEGKATCKTQHFCILLAFLIIIIALLIPVSI